MEILYPEKHFETDSNLRHVASHAIEGDYAHMFHQGSDPTNPPQLTVATAGTAVSVPITFPRPYAQKPRVHTDVISATNNNTWLSSWPSNITKTGFTLNANSGAAQTLSLNWSAQGQSGG